MQFTRRWMVAALGAAPLASWGQSPAAAPNLGALSQRMGKAWLCSGDASLAVAARQVLAASQAAFEKQLAPALQRAASPEQAGSLRALVHRYGGYRELLAGAPSAESHKALVSSANEMLTLTQLANGSLDGLPWRARMASRQRLLSQRVALLGLTGTDTTRRERQAAVFEFEAALQTLQSTAGRDPLLRERLALVDTAWQPLLRGASEGRAAEVFMASERMLTLLDGVTDHYVRLNT